MTVNKDAAVPYGILGTGTTTNNTVLASNAKTYMLTQAVQYSPSWGDATWVDPTITKWNEPSISISPNQTNYIQLIIDLQIKLSAALDEVDALKKMQEASKASSVEKKEPTNVFSIDVSNLDTEEARKFIEKIISKHKSLGKNNRPPVSKTRNKRTTSRFSRDPSWR